MEFFKKNVNIKNTILAVLPFLLFFILKQPLYLFIDNKLLIDSSFSNLAFEIILFSFFICISILFSIKFIGKNRYIPSNLEFYLLFVFITGFGLIFFSPSTDWEFLKFKYIPWLKSVCYILPFYLILFVSFIGGVINIFTKRNIQDTKSNFLLEDNPRRANENTEYDNENLATKLFEVISENSFEKSFSIGIVGPWGNGKSSLLNYIFSKISKDNDTNKGIIQVRFSPYLIHSDDYARGFLNVLSQELSPYNGNISELFHRYAKSISNVSKYLKIIELPNEKDNSSTKLYDKINKGIEKINKKIVVYLDDLDRLDDKEILQILKLIRNSANFKNTIFLVAMDKEYILKRLLSNNKNLNTVFIDKFFQLEVYLPQINSLKLKNYFIQEIETSIKIKPKTKRLIINSFKKNKLLFEYYIKNYRDLKKLINQISFESQFTPGEIAIKDLINFILLKTKYPSIIPLITENEDFFFDIRDNTYTLKDNDKKSEDYKLSETIFLDLTRTKIKFDNYKLFDDLYNKESIIKDHLSHLESKDLKLILITLITLFGKNNALDSISIRYKANYRKLVQQNLLEEDVSLELFEKLLTSDDFEIILREKFLNDKKLNNLLMRLEYYNSKTVDEEKQILKILSFLLNTQSKYDYKILRLINNIAGEEKFQTANKEFIISNLLGDKSILSNYNKLLVIGEIWESKSENNFWGIPNEKFKDLTVSNFKNYLDEHNNDNIWDAGDNSFFRIFHTIKEIETTKTNQLIQDFWSKNNFEILLSQMISIPNLTKGVYILSDVTDLIFKSKKQFIEFILNHKDIKTPEGVEISRFFELSKIVDFKRGICFDFKQNKSILKAQEKNERKNRYKDLRIKQVFFKINNQLLADVIRSNYTGALAISYHWFEDIYYIVVEIPNSSVKYETLKFTEWVYEIAKEKLGWNDLKYNEAKVLEKEIFLINAEPNASMKAYSIQPEIKKPLAQI